MQFIVNGIKSDVRESDREALSRFQKTLLGKNAEIFIYKKSIDARKKSDIKYVRSFLVKTEDKGLIKRLSSQKSVTIHKKTELFPDLSNKNREKLPFRPIIIGAGPAGLFCGYFLAKYGYSPIIFERGEKIEDREKSVSEFQKNARLNTESNIQFGEGGAGAFSDGKLTTRINDPLVSEIIDIFSRCAEIPELKYLAHPHVGTDKLKKCVKNIREEIIKMGGELRFSDKITDFETKNGKISAVFSEKSGKIPCNIAVLATGHSAKDIYSLLKEKNISLEQKSFSVGVRVEHFREDINKMQYEDFASLLPAAEYRVFHHLSDGHTVYSFCMCPGGTVVPSQSEEETILINGMSEYKRNGKNSNSAICVSVSPNDFGKNIFDGLNFIEKIEKNAFLKGGKDYKAPFMTLGDFLKKPHHSPLPEPTYALGIKETDFSEIFPNFITDGLKNGFSAFENSKKGFSTSGAILTACETRTSSPLRITRTKELESPDASGLYPCGEGAGYAGGIVSAAADGAKIAFKIISEYKF